MNRKINIFIITVLIVLPFSISALTLYEYFGGNLPSLKSRAPVFNYYFPTEIYKGTADQNTRFVQKLIDHPILGAAFSTITSTDKLTNFPSVYNQNLGNSANTTTPNSWSGLQQFQGNASTTGLSAYLAWFGATATSSFSTAGALTLITPLTVANGGTGSTTLSSNQVLLGNGTGNVSTVSGWGTTNYALVSNGGTSAPTWQAQQTDQTANYMWTGNQRFGLGATTTILVASSTATNPLILNTLRYNTPSTRAASSTALLEDGSGNLKWNTLDWQQICEQTLASANATSTCSWTASAKDLKIAVSVPSLTVNCSTKLTFNTDYGGTGTNYGYRAFQNYSLVQVSNPSQNYAIRFSQEATTSPIYLIYETDNSATKQKNGFYQFVVDSAAPMHYSGVGRWNNTSDQITTVNFNTDPTTCGNLGSGTRITVYGKGN